MVISGSKLVPVTSIVCFRIGEADWILRAVTVGSRLLSKETLIVLVWLYVYEGYYSSNTTVDSNGDDGDPVTVGNLKSTWVLVIDIYFVTSAGLPVPDLIFSFGYP